MSKISYDKPAPPKRPLSAFFLYKNDLYEATKKENPQAKVTELTKIISEKWRNIDQSTKESYETKQAEEKDKYKKLLSQYEEKHGKVEKKKRKSSPDDKENEKTSEKANVKKPKGNKQK